MSFIVVLARFIAVAIALVFIPECKNELADVGLRQQVLLLVRHITFK